MQAIPSAVVVLLAILLLSALSWAVVVTAMIHRALMRRDPFEPVSNQFQKAFNLSADQSDRSLKSMALVCDETVKILRERELCFDAERRELLTAVLRTSPVRGVAVPQRQAAQPTVELHDDPLQPAPTLRSNGRQPAQGTVEAGSV